MENNFLYYHGVDYEYDSYSCGGCYGCQTGDDYCRGSVYRGLRVEIIPDQLLKSFTTDVEKLETKYLIDRLLSTLGMYDGSNYKISASPDYYGEEVDEITFQGEWGKFVEIYDILCLEDVLDIDEKFKLLLELEYSMLIEDISGVWAVRVPFSDLVPSENMKKLKQDDRKYNKELPIGLYKKINNKFKLIDGRHRYQANIGKDYVNIYITD